MKVYFREKPQIETSLSKELQMLQIPVATKMIDKHLIMFQMNLPLVY